MIQFDEIITVMDIVSTKKTNTIATKVISTASINYHSKKNKRLLYFARSFISDCTTIANYCYLQSCCKTKIH